MDMATITALISSVGFPIACCIGLAMYVNTTVKDLAKTVQNNTIVLEKILTKLDANE